jgi:hypothetical protein
MVVGQVLDIVTKLVEVEAVLVQQGQVIPLVLGLAHTHLGQVQLQLEFLVFMLLVELVWVEEAAQDPLIAVMGAVVADLRVIMVAQEL